MIFSALASRTMRWSSGKPNSEHQHRADIDRQEFEAALGGEADGAEEGPRGAVDGKAERIDEGPGPAGARCRRAPVAEAGDGEQQRHIGDRNDDDEPALHGLKILPVPFFIQPVETQSQLEDQVHRGFGRMIGALDAMPVETGFLPCCNRRFLLCLPIGRRRRASGGGSAACHDKEGRMLKEFQEFISKGNVMDLAVGVIIGAAFGKIVTSLVDDVIMPIVGAIFGGLDFNNYFFPLSSAVNAQLARRGQGAGRGLRLWQLHHRGLNFLILAFIIFLMVKAVNNLRKRLEREKPAAPAAPPPADVALLTEIRDLLARK